MEIFEVAKFFVILLVINETDAYLKTFIRLVV